MVLRIGKGCFFQLLVLICIAWVLLALVTWGANVRFLSLAEGHAETLKVGQELHEGLTFPCRVAREVREISGSLMYISTMKKKFKDSLRSGSDMEASRVVLTDPVFVNLMARVAKKDAAQLQEEWTRCVKVFIQKHEDEAELRVAEKMLQGLTERLRLAQNLLARNRGRERELESQVYKADEDVERRKEAVEKYDLSQMLEPFRRMVMDNINATENVLNDQLKVLSFADRRYVFWLKTARFLNRTVGRVVPLRKEWVR